jgi:FtsH Extracellular.
MRKIMIPVMSVLLLALIISGFYSLNKPRNEMTYPAFLEFVEQGLVSEVTLYEEKNTFDAYLSDSPDTGYKVPNPRTENFVEFLLTNNIKVSYKDGKVSDIFGIIVIAIVAFGIIYYTRRGNSSISVTDANKKETKHQK